MSVAPFIWVREESRYYWFRLTVPLKYQKIAGKKIVQHSLRTTDLRKAVRASRIEYKRLIAEWECNRIAPKVDPRREKILALEWCRANGNPHLQHL